MQISGNITTSWETTSRHSTAWVKIFEAAYHYIAPFNITLACFILIHNSIIFADYYKDRKRIVTAMFMFIAAADIFSAVGEVVRGITALACYGSPYIYIPAWIVVFYLSVGIYGQICSAFCTTVLAVTKTIHIVNPFHRINKTAIAVILILGAVFWLAVAIADNVVLDRTLAGEHSCAKQWTVLFSIKSIGSVFDYLLFELGVTDLRAAYLLVLPIIQYFVPCAIVFFCMVIQMVYIKKSMSGSDNPELNTANHVNITVFLLSMLYFICNGSLSIFLIYTFIVASGKFLDY